MSEISIHALLAESDIVIFLKRDTPSQFLSTLSLRRATPRTYQQDAKRGFLSTLSLRRATSAFDVLAVSALLISIHALLAESDSALACSVGFASLFLSTLSLRRATAVTTLGAGSVSDFYPRSPCGERPEYFLAWHCIREISIHALLAESDT